MYRYSNGRFKSKRRHELEQKRKKDALRGMSFMTVSLLTIGLMFGFALQPYTFVMQSVEAQEVIEPDYLCELDVVECDGEVDERVQKAIDAVNKALDKEVTQETKNRIEYLYEKSIENNVPFEDAVKTVYCESQWYSQQSNAVYDTGEQELSFGLSQIHLPSHKNVTKEMAMDAYYSIDFLINHWYTEQAKADKMWFGYSRNETRNCTNGLQIEL